MGTVKINLKLKNYYSWSWSLWIWLHPKHRILKNSTFLLFHIAFKRSWLTTVWGHTYTKYWYIFSLFPKASSCYSGRVLTERDNLFVYKWVMIFEALLTAVTFFYVFPYYLQGTVRGLSVSFDSCFINTEDQALY